MAHTTAQQLTNLTGLWSSLYSGTCEYREPIQRGQATSRYFANESAEDLRSSQPRLVRIADRKRERRDQR